MRIIGASGIDGIISSASAFCSSLQMQTTLLIGDVAALHDVNALHTLESDSYLSQSLLTSVLVNNNGGGIFSFLPISKHGDDVGFNEFFGTPTACFSFKKAAEAAGIRHRSASSFADFKNEYAAAIKGKEQSIVEAHVVNREANVAVHGEISQIVVEKIEKRLHSPETVSPISFDEYESSKFKGERKTMLLLHGWLGSKNDWRETVKTLSDILPDWKILALDLPGHGGSLVTSKFDHVKTALNIQDSSNFEYSIDGIAVSILTFLHERGVELDAICGYSLGGRIGLAMQRLNFLSESRGFNSTVVKKDTKLILLGSYPGDFRQRDDEESILQLEEQRMKVDDDLAQLIQTTYEKSMLFSISSPNMWVPFLEKWYSSPIWGNLRNSSKYEKMVLFRAKQLSHRGPDIARVLQTCSPPRNSNNDWKFASPELTLFVAGSLDDKYSSIGKDWKNLSAISYDEIDQAGHAVLTEAPNEVAKIIYGFLTSTRESLQSLPKFGDLLVDLKAIDQSQVNSENDLSLIHMDFETFSLGMGDTSTNRGVFGIGWDQDAKPKEVKVRKGIILSLISKDIEGLGEISPLSGLHPESLTEAEEQTEIIQKAINDGIVSLPKADSSKLLALNGDLGLYIDKLVESCGIHPSLLKLSVRSGLEMALISIAAQMKGISVPEAFSKSLIPTGDPLFSEKSNLKKKLPLNGIETRTPKPFLTKRKQEEAISFTSTKIKVGHRSVEEDADMIAKRCLDGNSFIRADANRSWSKEEAFYFAQLLHEMNFNEEKFEYIEEPLPVQNEFNLQVKLLEEYYTKNGIKYALDETLADLVFEKQFDFITIRDTLLTTMQDIKGCAGFILKPTILGTEMTVMLAKLAHELGFAAVFTSSFESDLGLAYISYLATFSDLHAVEERAPMFPHGLGTFALLHASTMAPSFASFVSSSGEVDVEKLSQCYQGASIVETKHVSNTKMSESTVEASISLPFSSEMACTRFSDWPQHVRWSPWLTSVTYVDGENSQSETEWVLNIKGIRLQWRAISTVQSNPTVSRVLWESVSGLTNRGSVKFISSSSSTCTMTVTITFRTPRPIAMIFKNNEFLKAFMKNKLLQWSLEMFRDIVRSDLALERGDVELGDALFGAVEGKASAIEATFTSTERT